MAATQIGTTHSIGVAVLSGYTVNERTEGNADIDYEDIFDEDGARATRIVFQVDPKLTLDLLLTSGGTPPVPATQFPEGGMCTVVGLTAYFVDSCPVTYSKGATRVQPSMTNIGIT